MLRRWRLMVGAVVVLLVGAFGVFVSLLDVTMTPELSAQTRIGVLHADLIRALECEDLESLARLEAAIVRPQEDGAFVDYWGTPVRFCACWYESAFVVVLSGAGEDRTFATDDDVFRARSLHCRDGVIRRDAGYNFDVCGE